MQRAKREDAIRRTRPAARRRSLASAAALLVAVAGSRAIRAEVAAAQSAAAPNAADTSAVDRAWAALPERDRSTIDTYLRTDCELGDEGKALKPVLALGSAGRPYLEAVARYGPPAEIRKEADAAIDKSWAARLQYLGSAPAEKADPEALAQIRSITPAQYRADQRASLDAKYRERAALALRTLGGAAIAPSAVASPGVAR